MSSAAPNLFIRLHRWASRQDENFTTEAFVYLLEHLLASEPPIATDLLDRLTGSDGIIEGDTVNLRITTQQRAENLIPDIWVEGSKTLVLVEVKVTAELSAGQVQSYRDFLEKQVDRLKRRLVLLTRFPVTGNTYEDVLYLRWHQVAQWLEEYLLSPALGEISRYQIEMFLGFLRWQGAAPLQVRSGLSQAIADYQMQNAEASILARRIRNLDRLRTISELEPLYNLLLMMDEAVAGLSLPRPAKFDSGSPKNQEGGWIGYNLNDMEYFFFVQLDHPERVMFQIYNRQITVEQIAFGELRTRNRRLFWFNKLDLNSPNVNFF